MAYFISENIKESGFILNFTSICKAIRTDIPQPFLTTIKKLKNVFKKQRKEMPTKFSLSYKVTPQAEDL